MFDQSEKTVPPPQILGDRYELLNQFSDKPGRKVFVALDRHTQTPVIVKWLTFGNDFTWDALKLFEREAEVLKNLDHPAIPKYLDYFDLDLPQTQSKGLVLVQSYIQAQSLEEHLRAGRTFSEEDLTDLATQILEILQILHHRNPPIIHRDIKPSNILLGDRSGNSMGQVYLIDFGAVQTLLPQEGQTFTVVGTYGYMPMEQFGGRTAPASDLYSLGATLLRIATGQEPADIPQTDFRFEFEPLAQLSPMFTHWLKLMVEPDLKKRYANATAALAGLSSPVVPNREIHALLKRQPQDSPLLLTVQDDTLHLHCPNFGHNINTLLSNVFGLGFGGLCMLWIAFSNVLGPFGWVVWLMLPGWVFCAIAWWSQKLDIFIDPNCISGQRTVLDRFTIHRQKSPRDRVNRIELKTHFEANSAIPSTAVIIVAGGGQCFEIPTISKQESQWLGEVFRQSLGVEVHHNEILSRSPKTPHQRSNDS